MLADACGSVSAFEQSDSAANSQNTNNKDANYLEVGSMVMTISGRPPEIKR
jgi:hypothetical protein